MTAISIIGMIMEQAQKQETVSVTVSDVFRYLGCSRSTFCVWMGKRRTVGSRKACNALLECELVAVVSLLHHLKGISSLGFAALVQKKKWNSPLQKPWECIIQPFTDGVRVYGIPRLSNQLATL